jgi:hypothetical protein
MAALAVTIPSNTGTLATGAAVSASDTVDQSLLGSRGAFLRINNAGGSTDNITISDSGTTRAGNALTSNQITASQTTTQVKTYLLQPSQVSSTGLITITHSFITSVTYELYPLL